jgi:hypothetical protein
LDRRLGGPQRRSGRGGEEKNSQPPPGIEHLRAQYIITIILLLALLGRGSLKEECKPTVFEDSVEENIWTLARGSNRITNKLK